MRRPHFRRVIAAFTTVASAAAALRPYRPRRGRNRLRDARLQGEGRTVATAVAVITLVDRSKDGSGTIIGQQRIDGAVGTTEFSVPYDSAQVVSTHAYRVVASIIDGDKEWQSQTPVPTINPPGAATEGLSVDVVTPQYTDPTEVTGTIAVPASVNTTALSPSAVAYAIVVNGTTGRVVGRQVNPAPTGSSIPFTVTYDADLVAPEDPLLAVAAVADGAHSLADRGPPRSRRGRRSTWPGREGTLPVPRSPAPSGQPTPPASGSAAPTTKPTGNPTAEPTGTPDRNPDRRPAGTPTEAPAGRPPRRLQRHRRRARAPYRARRRRPARRQRHRRARSSSAARSPIASHTDWI